MPLTLQFDSGRILMSHGGLFHLYRKTEPFNKKPCRREWDDNDIIYVTQLCATLQLNKSI